MAFQPIVRERPHKYYATADDQTAREDEEGLQHCATCQADNEDDDKQVLLILCIDSLYEYDCYTCLCDYLRSDTHILDIHLSGAKVWMVWRVYREIKWIQVVTAILSILGSGSIIGYAVFQSAVRSPEVRPLFFLSVSDLFLALCWLIGAFMYRKSVCSKNVVCYNIQTVGQMVYLSTFFYTLNYLWQLCCNLKRQLENELQISKKQWRLANTVLILSSVVPVFLTTPVLYFGNANDCYENSSHPHSCLVLNTGSFITLDPQAYKNDTCTAIYHYSTCMFLIMFSLTVISILVLYGYSVSLLKKYKMTDQQSTSSTVIKRSFLLYSAIFLFYCTPVVILAILKLFSPSGKINEFALVLYYIQAFTAISQGFLNSCAYGFTQQMLRCLKQDSYHDMETQTPLLRSQKRHYASTHNTTSAATPQKSTFL
ncbi:transmembrane protein 116 [Pelodytes ibericus]